MSDRKQELQAEKQQGTSAARFDWLARELEKRWTDPKPFSAAPFEPRFLAWLDEQAQAIQALRDELKEACIEATNAAGFYADSQDRCLALEAQLRSAHAIAARKGVDTAWGRFAASCQALGIGSVTARTYRVLPSDGDEPLTPPAQESSTP